MPEEVLQMILQEMKKSYDTSGYPEICTDFLRTEEYVPMRDGVRLRTLLFKPKSKQESFPIILQRTCYPHLEAMICFHGEQMAKRGYLFVCQFCRGTGGSEGDWTPNIHEREDGLDTLRWLNGQAWAGRIGVWGSSYGAAIGWAMADAAKGLAASMYLGEYGCDRFTSAYQKGSFRHDVLTSWTMENAGFPVTADYLESCRYMPQVQVDEALWGGRIDWYRDYITNTHPDDAYWQSGWWKTLREIPTKVEIPLFVGSGWYDHHHGSTMKTWETLPEGTREHCVLEVGGWNHFGANCAGCLQADNNVKTEVKNVLQWFEETLVEGKLPEGKIRLYEMGKDCWREYRSLEEIRTEERKFYFAPHKLTEKLQGGTEEIRYLYDPSNPVMTHGAESVLRTMDEVGSRLQPEPDWRADVVSFVSEPLESELPLWGKLKVEMFVISDCEDTAFTAKVMEVHENGEAYNIRSSITTIAADVSEAAENGEATETGDAATGGQNYKPGTPVKVVIEMWDILYTLQKGSRLRVDISSSDFPQYNIHSNYPGIWAKQEKTRVANQTVLCGENYPSALILPVCR